MQNQKEILRMKRMYGTLDRSFYFNISPVIVPSQKESDISLEYDFDSLKLEGEFEAAFMPYNDYVYSPYRKEYKADTIRASSSEGKVTFRYLFEKEQMYIMEIYEIFMGEKILLHKTAVYALDDDLYNFKALKGDLHSHTNNSDGFDTPELIVGAARKCGLDFLAVTDHNNYKGSVKAKEVNPLSLTIVHGEEFSSNFTPMHIISLGAHKPIDYSNYIVKEDEILELEKMIEERLTDKISPETDKIAYACTLRLINRIHEAGGLAIMCHTFWKPVKADFRMDVPETLILDLLRNCSFDAYEVVTGSPLDSEISTDMQISFLNEAGLDYNDIAYMGVTDSHTYSIDPLCGNHYTIVFAKDNTEEAIIDAIKKKRTVAVEKIDGKIDKCYGALRYVKYAHFLIKFVFPKRDRRAYLEGLSYQERIRKN